MEFVKFKHYFEHFMALREDVKSSYFNWKKTAGKVEITFAPRKRRLSGKVDAAADMLWSLSSRN